MRIICTGQFKDTVDGMPTSFEKGDVCSVPDKDGIRFCAHGWAVEEGKPTVKSDSAMAPVDLNVQSGKLGTSSKVI